MTTAVRRRQQVAGVEKRTARPVAAATRPAQQQKTTAGRAVRQTAATQRPLPPASAAPKPPASRRPALERPKPTRVANIDAAAGKGGIKKGRPPSVGGPFPAEVDREYAMKIFMAQRESQVSVGIPVTPEKPSVTGIFAEASAPDDSEVADVDRLPHQTHVDPTHDRLTSSWLEFLAGTDELQHQSSDIGVSGFAKTIPDMPQSNSHDGTVDEQNWRGHTASKTAVSNVDKGSGTGKTGSATEVRSESGHKKAVGGVTQTELMLNSERYGAQEDWEAQTWHHSAVGVTQEELMRKAGFHEAVSGKIELFGAQKDEEGQTYQSTHGDADGKRVENVELQGAHEDADKWRKESLAGDETGFRSEEGRLSSESLHDDRLTLPDDEQDDDFSDVRMLGHHVTSSIEIPLSTLSDRDPELAALSTRSSVSGVRDLTSPNPPPSTPPVGDQDTATMGDPNLPKADAVVHASNNVDDDGDPNPETVTVIDKEAGRNGPQTADSGEDCLETQREGSSTAVSSSGDNFSPLKADNVDNDYSEDEDVYWSGSDYEEEDELWQLRSASFEEETDEVDPATVVGHLSDTQHQEVAFRYELAPENKATAFAGVEDAGKTHERVRGDMSSRQETAAEDGDKQKATMVTVERDRSNAENTELERGNDDAEIRETPSYLEREYAVPILTPLNRDHDWGEALRGEGPSVHQDVSAAGLYSLGEDGLPDFTAEYSMGIDFTGANLTDNYNPLSGHDGGKAVDGVEAAAIGGHVLPHFDPENPGGTKNAEGMDNEMEKAAIDDEIELMADYALPASVDPLASVRNVDHLLDTV